MEEKEKQDKKREQWRINSRRFYYKNKKKCIDRIKKYQETHQEQEKVRKSDYSKVYRIKNLEKFKENSRIYRIKNKQKIKEYNRKRDNGLYARWKSIKSRCSTNIGKNFENYKSRGIILLWETYYDFKNDMYKSFIEHIEKYGKIQTTIERIDNNGNYCKENCCWATRSEQNRNQRKRLTNVSLQNVR